MAKRKLTLSVNEDLLREVKNALAGRGKTLSEAVEELLELMLASRWIEKLAKSLKLGDLLPLDPLEIPRQRPKGLDAARVVRELRDGRVPGP